jgi:hypothetical protein
VSLTADQKEAIMASRGESAAAPAQTGTRRYVAHFANGKRAIVLDMASRPEGEVIQSTTSIFQPGYCVAVEPVNA